MFSKKVFPITYEIWAEDGMGMETFFCKTSCQSVAGCLKKIAGMKDVDHYPGFHFIVMVAEQGCPIRHAYGHELEEAREFLESKEKKPRKTLLQRQKEIQAHNDSHGVRREWSQ